MAIGYSFQPYRGLANSILKNQPGDSFLPNNYGFSDLANYEELRRKKFGQSLQDRIEGLRTNIGSAYDTALKNYQDTTAARRSSLATSLADTARKTFEQNNPYILEDLNRRGLFTSPSEVGRSQAQALKELELENQKTLMNFDETSRAHEDALAQQRLADLNQLQEAAVSGASQADLDALNASLDLRRSQLEAELQNTQSNKEEQLARDLARQQSRNSLINSLIGVGGSIGGAYLTGRLLSRGFAPQVPQTADLSKLAAQTPQVVSGAIPGTVTGTTLTSAGTPVSRLFPGGIGQVGTPIATKALPAFGPGGTLLNTSGTASLGLGSGLAGAGGYYAGTKALGAGQSGDQAAMNVGGALGGIGGSFFGPVGAAGGAALGTAVGKGTNRLVKGTEKSLGGTVGSIARYANPFTGLPAVTGKISKAFGGNKKGSTGSGQEVADQQRQLDQDIQDFRELKAALQRGEIGNDEYLAIAQPKADEISQRVGGLTARGSKWANAINPHWQRFLNEGFIGNQGNKWVALA